MASGEWKRIAETMRECCAQDGLDILHAFGTGAYNGRVPAEWRVHDFGGKDRLGILLGNTRALWPHFIGALRADPVLTATEHPLHEYVRARLVRAIAGATERPHHLTWAHQIEPRALPIQRLAELVGLASLGPSHLSVHPDYGPWFALQAVVVFDVAGPSEPATPLQSPCAACSQPCVAALERAMRATQSAPSGAAIAQHPEPWIAVRDACPVGREARYGQLQLAYHYTKDRSLLG